MTSAIRTLLGLALGLAAGATAAAAGGGAAAALAAPVGQLWLDALKMTTVPLVFALIVGAVATSAGAARAGGVAARAMGWFAALLILSALIGALLLPLLLRIVPLPAAAVAALRAGLGVPRPLPLPPSLADWIGGIMPANPVKAAVDGNMLQIAVIALLVGFALLALDTERRDRMAGLLDAVAETMLVIVRWIIRLAPIGVFALAFAVAARSGLAVAGALVHYVALVSLVCLALLPTGYAVAMVAGRIGLRRFARAAAPAQAVAVATQSSLAAMPLMVEGARHLGIREPAARLALPLAVAAFRVTSPAANLAVILYCAALFGVTIAPAQLAAGIVVAVLISFSTLSLPSQISFFTALIPIAAATGVPTLALPLLLAVETIPDIFRTLGNVTADLAVTAAAGRDPDDARAPDPA